MNLSTSGLLTAFDGDGLPATEWCQHYLPCCQPASHVAEILRFIVRSVQAKEWL